MDAGFADEPAAAGQLTEAELRLAALVRAGIVDAEIAVRLTTTVGQVRARIEALVARCGLASRAELKATDIALLAPRAAPATSHFISEAAAPGAAAPRAPAARAAAPRPGPAVTSEHEPRWPRRTAAIACVAALALAAWAIIAGPWGAASRQAAQPPPLTLPPRSVSTTRVSGQFEMKPRVELPAGLALYTVAGSPAELQRVYRGRDGQLRADTLFAANDGESISSAWALGDASDMALAICEKGRCGGSGTQVTTDAVAAVIRSRDGGISWSTVTRLAGGIDILGAVGDELLVQRRTAAGLEALLVPSGRTVEPPPGAAAGTRPHAIAGEVAWRTGDGAVLLDGDGREFFAFGVQAPNGLATVRTRAHSTETFALSWYGPSAFPDERDVTTYIAEARGSGEALNARTFSGPPLLLGPWTDAHALIVTAWRQPFDNTADHAAPFVAFMDLKDGTITRLNLPLAATVGDAAAPAVLAAVRGTFVRVGESAACVTLRAQPRATSEALGCVGPGSLAVVTTQRFIDGGGWLFVTLPSGTRGWLTTLDPAVILD